MKNRNEKKAGQEESEKPSFWQTLPGIITGITGLIAAIASLLGLFPGIISSLKGGGNDGGVDTNKSSTTASSDKPSGPITPTDSEIVCNVSGQIYNGDVRTNVVGIANVKIAYTTATQTNAIVIFHSDPKGFFRFKTFALHNEDFPIRLQLTVPTARGSQIINYEQDISPSGISDMDIPISMNTVARNFLPNRILMIPISTSPKPVLHPISH